MPKKTIIYQMNDLDDKIKQHEIAEYIKAGKLVIFPTETVYGLGGNALDPNASKAIYEAKGRPSDNPLIIHIANPDDIYKYAKNIPLDATILMDAFWPGPITFILEKQDIVPYTTTGGLHTVAIRMPDHESALKLIKLSETPIAAPSANTSGKPSSTTFKHVLDDFDGKVDAIIDGGDTTIGLESTVIDLTGDPAILRPGAITKSMIERILGKRILDLSDSRPSGEVRSPGMKYTHYKPKGNVTLINGLESHVKNFIADYHIMNPKRKIAVICADEYEHLFKGHKCRPLGSINDSSMMSRTLFKALRDMDEWKIDEVFIYYKETDELGYAMMNRMLKASGYSVLDL